MVIIFLTYLLKYAFIGEWLNFFQNQAWHLYTLVAVTIAVFLTYGVYLAHRTLRNQSYKKKEYLLLQTCVEAVYVPLIIFIWIQVIASKGNILLSYIDNSIVAMMEKARTVSMVVLLLWTFIRFIKLFEEHFLQGNFKSQAADKTTIQATGKIIRVAVFITVILLILPVLGIHVTGIVAFASGSAIIVGIAAQQIIANYFGGIVVLADGHFKVGDWIYSPDRNIEGVVEYIGWRSTHVRTFDRRLLYVPNSIFSSIIMINGSKMTNRRIKDTINIRYEDASVASKILKEINNMLQAQSGLDKSRRLAVHFNEFGPYSMKLTIYAFTKTVDWQEYRDIQQDIFLKIIKIINDNGAQIAIPPAAVIEGTTKKPATS